MSFACSFINPSTNPRIFPHYDGRYRLISRTVSKIALLLIGIDMPDDVVRQTDNLLLGALRHLRKALSLGLVLKGVGGEVDTCRRESQLMR